MIELSKFALLLKFCIQIVQALVGLCSKVYKLAASKENLTRQTILAKQILACFMYVYTFKHIPTSACTTLAGMFQQEFTHPNFNHLMESPI